MLKIRLRRMGAKHRPFYRVVVSESSQVPKSAFVENVGHYDPLRQPPVIQLDVERIDHWIGLGARPSDRVRKLMNALAVQKERGVPEPAPPAQATKEAKPETKQTSEAASEVKEEATEEPAAEAAADDAGESTEEE